MTTTYTLADLQNESLDFQLLVTANADELITLIKQVKNKGPSGFQSLSLGRVQGSKLTNKAGFYLLYSKKTQHMYFGSTNNLAQRKGEHTRGFGESKDLPPKLLEVIQNSSPPLTKADFQFVI